MTTWMLRGEGPVLRLGPAFLPARVPPTTSLLLLPQALANGGDACGYHRTIFVTGAPCWRRGASASPQPPSQHRRAAACATLHAMARKRSLAWCTCLYALLAAALMACGGERAPLPTGADLYRAHCAACHGSAGRGDGPVAESLRRAPADLTALARAAGGAFPEQAVRDAVEAGGVAAHGPREMPVWGVVFRSQHVGEPFYVQHGAREIEALVGHLRTLQAE
jgi:mono/diheme cytochrome c family protein